MTGQFSDKDDMDSLWRALIGTDQGGNDGRALPGGNAREPAERKRVRRQAAAFSMVYLHIEDERLKEMLDAIDDPDNAGYAAWQLVMQECGEGSSDLEIIKLLHRQCSRTPSSRCPSCERLYREPD